ncbi:MAG: hypothetical protein M3011_02630 [Actinomycetota bacterium]|nr:hypothetical protein [Actinomycetota bacterium]
MTHDALKQASTPSAPISCGSSSAFSRRPTSSLQAGVLIVAVALWNVFTLQDAVLTSARWSAAVPIENGLFGAIKIGLVVLLAHSFRGEGIFFAWVLAMAVMIVPVSALIFGRVLPSASGRSNEGASLLPIGDRRRVSRYLAVDYVAGLLNQGYTAVMPLLVLAVLGREANAYFYIAFMIGGAARAVAESMSTSLVVEGAHSEDEVATMARVSIVRYAKYALPGILALAAGANVILRPFGSAYAHHGTTLLRLLLVATVPHALITLYLGVERVRARVSRVLAVEASIVVLVSVGAVVGMRWFGLFGLGLGDSTESAVFEHGLAGTAGFSGVRCQNRSSRGLLGPYRAPLFSAFHSSDFLLGHLGWLVAHTLVAAFVTPAFVRACRRSP